jgi:hypothetical protein
VNIESLKILDINDLFFSEDTDIDYFINAEDIEFTPNGNCPLSHLKHPLPNL